MIEYCNSSCVSNGSNQAVSEISTLDALDEQLPSICNSLFEILGRKNLEATYQRALCIDLEEYGIKVDSEVSIDIMYKNRIVGTRRADIIITLPNKERAVVELKAVANLNSEHLKQLEYYLVHFDISCGYLINFPHETGFPDLDYSKHVFTQTNLSDDKGCLTDRKTRSHAIINDKPHIIRLHKDTISADKIMDKFAKLNLVSNAKVEKEPITGTNAYSPTKQTSRIYGITLKGTPCKLCINEGDYCKFHKNQRPA